MGWWLSDGSISKPKRGSWQIKITQEKEYNKDEIRQICKKIFYKTWEGVGATYIPIDEDTANYFLQFGHAFSKFIPKEIKNSSLKKYRNIFNIIFKRRRKR